jgi:hypothetical protein
VVSQFLKVTGKTYKAYQFITLTLPFFTDLFRRWYRSVYGKKVKVIPSNINELLTPLLLLIGSVHMVIIIKEINAIIISTESFSVGEPGGYLWPPPQGKVASGGLDS